MWNKGESSPLGGGHLPLFKYTVEKHTAPETYSCDKRDEKPPFTGSRRRKSRFNFRLSISSNTTISIVFRSFCLKNDLLFALLFLWNFSFLPLCMKCWVFNLSSYKCPVYTHTQQTSALSACSYNQGNELITREFRRLFLVGSNSSSWTSFGSIK